MLGHLARKELLLHLLSARFIFSVAVALALMLCSGWVLLRDHEAHLQAFEELDALHARQIGTYETGADTPLDALAGGGRILDRRPPSLAFLVAGIYGDLPKSFWLSDYDGPMPETNLVENRLSDLFDRVDFRFVIGAVFSLLALLLSYDAISGERQSGTLRLVFANAVRIRDVLIAKWLSLVGVLGAALVIAFLAALLLAMASTSVNLAAADLARLAVILFVSLLYLALFVTLGLLLSSLFAEPYAAIAVGLMAWVLVVFIIPGAAPYAAALGEDAPNYVGTAQARQDNLGYDFQTILQKHLAAGDDKATAVQKTVSFWRGTVEPERSTHLLRANEDFLNRKARRIERGRALARLSPYGAFSFAVSDAAGTGLAEQARFEQAVEDYQKHFKDFLRARKEAGQYKTVAAADLPAFTFTPEPLGTTLLGALPDVASLAFLTLALFAAAYVRMLRYDVR
jgi:ABC-type transport system involved in multi-copper enzyme maturation permease subunit